MTIYKVSDLLETVMSGEWGEEPNGDNDVRVIRTANFTNIGTVNLDGGLVERSISPAKVKAKKLKPGDIIIEKSGGSPKQPVGRVIYFDIDDGHTYLCNNFTSILRPNNQLINSRYLFYFLFHQHRIRKVLKFQNKTTGIINLKLNDYLSKTEMILPTIKEQENIVNILDRSQDLIFKRKMQVELLSSLVERVFIEMFGNPLNNNGRNETLPLKDLGVIQTGNTPSRKIKEHYGNYIEWIKSDNINTPLDTLTVAKEYLSELGAVKGRVAPKGSILVTCIAGSMDSIGNVAIADREVAFNQQINAITPNDKVDLYFLFNQFKVAKKLIQQASTNSMKGMVSKSKFGDISFIVPNKKEQLTFSNIYLKIEHQRKLVLKSLVKLENNFDSLLQRTFNKLLY